MKFFLTVSGPPVNTTIRVTQTVIAFLNLERPRLLINLMERVMPAGGDQEYGLVVNDLHVGGDLPFVWHNPYGTLSMPDVNLRDLLVFIAEARESNGYKLLAALDHYLHRESAIPLVERRAAWIRATAKEYIARLEAKPHQDWEETTGDGA